MPPAIYKALKATLFPLVKQFYELAVVPPEAPEKPDHGDLDIVVAYPHSDDAVDRVKDSIRAAHYLPQEGRGTSNFAIPVGAFDLPAESESGSAFSLSAQDTYIQVDVNVCADRESWERTVFLHSYGDTGMILGVIGRSAGVSLGVNGLKVRSISLLSSCELTIFHPVHEPAAHEPTYNIPVVHIAPAHTPILQPLAKQAGRWLLHAA